MKNFFINAIIILLITFFTGELAFRYLKPMPTYSSLKKEAGGFYKKSNFNTFTLKENFKGFFSSNDNSSDLVEVSTDNNGFRNTIPNIKSDKKILILGDSYTFGVYISDKNIYSSQLSKLINKNYPYEIINAGYSSGHNTDQQYSWFSNYLLNNGCPETTILGFFLGNDFNINKKAWLDKDKLGFPTKFIDKNIYVDKDGFLRSKKKSIHTVASESVYKIPLLRESHLLIAFTKVIRHIELKIKNISPSGWNFNNFKFIYGEYDDEFLRNEKLVLDLIYGLNLKMEKCNGNFIVLLLPINFMVNKDMFDIKFPNLKYSRNKTPVYYDRFNNQLESLKIRTINIYDSMQKDYEKNKIELFPKNGEVHFNSKGHYVTAKKIYEYMIKNSLIN